MISWPAAEGMRCVKPSSATEEPCGTWVRIASEREINSAMGIHAWSESILLTMGHGISVTIRQSFAGPSQQRLLLTVHSPAHQCFSRLQPFGTVEPWNCIVLCLVNFDMLASRFGVATSALRRKSTP